MRWIVVSVLTLVSSTALADDLKVEGRWNTISGPMTITRTEAGSYALVLDQYAGTVVGMLNDNVLSGTWQDIVKQDACASEKDGSAYWGTFSISFYGPPNIAKPAFQGLIAFCDNPNEGLNFAGELAD